eukprot:1352058-Rhodomonas_salina.1
MKHMVVLGAIFLRAPYAMSGVTIAHDGTGGYLSTCTICGTSSMYWVLMVCTTCIRAHYAVAGTDTWRLVVPGPIRLLQTP